MRGYLLDTSVLSLLVPGRAGVSDPLSDWFRANRDRLFVSTITVAEIQQGICKLDRAGGEKRAALLTTWLDELIETGAERILAFDVEAATTAGRLSDDAVAKGRHPGFADVAIAAIASRCDLTLLTLNGRHFEPLGIAFHDPTDARFLSA